MIKTLIKSKVHYIFNRAIEGIEKKVSERKL